jgi:hypothetical protein
MTTLLRILRLYPLALWAGGEVFFVLVAGIAFSVLPDAHSAGMVVRSALICTGLESVQVQCICSRLWGC